MANPGRGDGRKPVVLVARHAERSPRSVPLGAACAATALEAVPGFADSFDIAILDSFDDESPSALAARVAKRAPNAVGFSVYSWNHADLSAAAALLRAALPDTVFFAGGPEATNDPERLIHDYCLDFAVSGEAEGAADAIFRRLSGDASPGTVLRAEGLPASALRSPWLDGTAAPADDGVLWELARGCPYRCSYCFESRLDRRVRPFAEERVERELKRFVELGVAQAYVLDPTFNLDQGRASRLLDLFARVGPDIHYELEIRAELVDSAFARKCARIPCSLQIGLQSVEREALIAVDRDFDRAAFTRGVTMLEQAGATYGFDLIYGLPKDSLAGFLRSLDFALKLRPNHLDVFRLSVLPGTKLADDAPGFGLDAMSEAPYHVRSTPTFPAAALDEAESWAAAVDLVYNRGRAVGWFQPLAKACALSLTDLLDLARRDPAARALSGAAPGDPRIEDLQVSMAEQASRRITKPGPGAAANFARVASELIRLHGAWGRALAEGQATTLELSHDPDELLGPATLDLRSYALRADEDHGYWIVKPDREQGAVIVPD